MRVNGGRRMLWPNNVKQIPLHRQLWLKKRRLLTAVLYSCGHFCIIYPSHFRVRMDAELTAASLQEHN